MPLLVCSPLPTLRSNCLKRSRPMDIVLVTGFNNSFCSVQERVTPQA